MKSFTLAMISAAASVQAAIVTDGLWTDHDWTHSGTGYTMTNGIPGSADANTNRRLTAPIACSDEEASDYMSKENVSGRRSPYGHLFFSSAPPGQGHKIGLRMCSQTINV